MQRLSDLVTPNSFAYTVIVIQVIFCGVTDRVFSIWIDCRMGPAVQDLWMMISGDRMQQQLQLENLNRSI